MPSFRQLTHAAAALLLFQAAGSAQDSQSTLIGRWTLAQHQEGVIERAIEHGIDDMSFVTKPIARRRLQATNDAYSSIELRIAQGTVTTVLEGRPIDSPGDGSPIRWTREDGEAMQVATALRNGTLVQTFTAEDGSRENVYSVSPDGRRLTLQVTIRSGRLPQPVTYRLAYDRAP